MSDDYLTPGVSQHVWIAERYMTSEKMWVPAEIFRSNPGGNPQSSDSYRVRRATITVGALER